MEYIDVPWDWSIGEEDREYALLNVHTGSFNEKHGDRQLHGIHDDVTNHVMDVLSPEHDGKRLDLDAQNTHFSVDGWSREPDSINYEREYLDPGEEDVYLSNLPEEVNPAPKNPEKYPLFEVILWDEGMDTMLWHVIGFWAGSDISEAVILREETPSGEGGWF